MLKAMLGYTPMFLLGLAAPAPFAAAATYFVAPHGDDSRAGTESQPWKTLRKAAAAVQPGDTVRIKAGSISWGQRGSSTGPGPRKVPSPTGPSATARCGSRAHHSCRPKNGHTSRAASTRLRSTSQSWPCSNPLHRPGPGRQSHLQQRVLRRGKAGRDQPELDRQPGLPQHVCGFRVCRRIPPGQGGEPCAEQHHPGCRQDLPRLANQALPQTLDSNLYYNASGAPVERDGVAYRAFADYQQSAGETHSHYADPQLVGPADAHLQPGSPAIDAGVRQQEVTIDIDGIARPQTPPATSVRMNLKSIRSSSAPATRPR